MQLTFCGRVGEGFSRTRDWGLLHKTTRCTKAAKSSSLKSPSDENTKWPIHMQFRTVPANYFYLTKRHLNAKTVLKVAVHSILNKLHISLLPIKMNLHSMV